MLRYWRLVVLFISACTVWTLLFLSLDSSLEERVHYRARRVAEEASIHLLDRLESRIKSIRTMSVMAANYPVYTQEIHDSNAKSLMEQFIGLYAVNWANPKGWLQWVYPLEPNRSAHNQNLMLRPELVPLLQESRDTGEVRISTRIMTYQGFYGTSVYAPIFRESKFLGWINGLIDYNLLLHTYFAEDDRRDYAIELRWAPDELPFYSHGDWERIEDYIVVEKAVPTFNQTLNIKVGSNLPKDLLRARYYFMVLFTVGVGTLLILVISLARLVRSERRLTNANRLLTSKSTLVSALSHDLSTSVMILSNNIRKLKDNTGDQTVAFERLDRAVQTLHDLLVAVRNLHVDSLSKEKHDLAAIDVVSTIEESVNLVRDLFERKQLNIVLDLKPGRVLANRVTMVNCVLLNVLKNAIKFSESGGKIFVSAEPRNNQIVVSVRDEGVGIDPKQLQKLFMTLLSPTTEGTAAESGTGLGLFQVKYFMEAYGGRVEIESDQTKGPGTTVRMWFRAIT